jgi:DNA-binding MarR family transcriptional regulator
VIVFMEAYRGDRRPREIYIGLRLYRVTTRFKGDTVNHLAEPSEPTSFSDADYRRLAAFRHALRGFLVFSEAAARAAGVTAQQHQALLAIKGAVLPACATVGGLAEQLQLQPNSAAELTDRMVKGGLLVRATAPHDRRKVVLTLTDDAEDVLRRLSAAHVRELRVAAPVLEGLLAVLKAKDMAPAAP